MIPDDCEVFPILVELPWLVLLAQGWRLPPIVEHIQWNGGRHVILLWRP